MKGASRAETNVACLSVRCWKLQIQRVNIRFPRAFAAGKKEDHGRTYYFYTKESLQDFEKAPSDYIRTAS